MKVTDWSAVQDGLGSAREVPALIENLASTKKAQREAAFTVLSEERLVHQGTVWAAAPLAVPLLVESLTAKKHPGRALIFALLGTIAVGDPLAYLQGGAGRDALAALLVTEDVEGRAYRAVRDRRAEIVDGLADRSADVRAHAAAVLALVDPALAVTELAAWLEREVDPEARVAGRVYLGLAARLAATSIPPSVDATSDGERTAQAVASAFAHGPLDGEALATALSPPIADLAIPFGVLGDVAVGAALVVGERGREILARVLLAAAPPRNILLASTMVRSLFPGAHQGPTDAPLIPSSALSPSALEVIRLVAKVAPENSWPPIAYLTSVGVTRWLPDLKRFVGLDPAGPLERRVAWRGGEVEAIIVLDALARGEAQDDEARAALVANASPAERVELALVAPTNAYQRLHLRPGWSPERAIPFASSLLPAEGAAPRLVEHARAEDVRDYGIWVLLDGLARLCEADDLRDVDLAPIAVRAAPMMRGPVYIDILSRCLDRFPVSTRDAAVSALPLPDKVDPAPRIRAQLVEPNFGGWSFIHHLSDRPQAARRVAGAVAAWTPLLGARDIRPVEPASHALAALRPESRAAIEEVLPTATEYGRSILEPLLSPN